MDLSGVFEHGHGYVALSRVRSLAGLHLLGWSHQALLVHPRVAEMDARFREHSDDAENAFAEMTPQELKDMQAHFIRVCGGTIEKAKVRKTKKKK